MSRLTHVGFLVVALLAGLPAPGAAQLNASEATATLTATLPESLTVSLLPGAVNFTLTSGSATNPGDATISTTTSWTLSVTRTSVTLYGYFSSDTAALAHTSPTNTVDIPSARVETSINGGAAVPFDQSSAFGAGTAGREIFSQGVTTANATGSRTDTLALNINLGSYALPADTYIGTLRIRAQATP